jgi:hypothetical protein
MSAFGQAAAVLVHGVERGNHGFPHLPHRFPLQFDAVESSESPIILADRVKDVSRFGASDRRLTRGLFNEGAERRQIRNAVKTLKMHSNRQHHRMTYEVILTVG